MTEYFVMGGAALIIVIALSYVLTRLKIRRTSPETTARRPALTNCPICGSPLARGEQLVSRVWRPLSVPEQRIIVSGCPHCYPSCAPGVKRRCPVCGKTLSASGYLVAHLFNLPEGKKHVVVTGCNLCCEFEKKI